MLFLSIFWFHVWMVWLTKSAKRRSELICWSKTKGKIITLRQKAPKWKFIERFFNFYLRINFMFLLFCFVLLNCLIEVDRWVGIEAPRDLANASGTPKRLFQLVSCLKLREAYLARGEWRGWKSDWLKFKIGNDLALPRSLFFPQ